MVTTGSVTLSSPRSTTGTASSSVGASTGDTPGVGSVSTGPTGRGSSAPPALPIAHSPSGIMPATTTAVVVAMIHGRTRRRRRAACAPRWAVCGTGGAIVLGAAVMKGDDTATTGPRSGWVGVSSTGTPAGSTSGGGGARAGSAAARTATAAASGRAAGSSAVISTRRPVHSGPSHAGISGAAVRRASTAPMPVAWGNARRPVAASSSMSPRA